MRAFVCTTLSQDLSGTALLDLPRPEPGAGEVRIRVRAASVNFPDVLMCQGKYQFRPEPPFTPGLEVSGEISGVGANVTGVAIGDAVVGTARLGGFAEEVLVSAEGVSPKPDALTWEQAAAFSTAYLTAYVSLVRRARLEAGETLLVLGAAGGVGLAACDLGRILGARVIAVASSAEKRAFLEAYGIEHVLPAPGFRDQVKALTADRGADVIFDPVGGDAFDEAVRCIGFDGRLLSVGFASGRIPTLSVNHALIKGFSLMGVRAGEYGRRFPDRGRENIAAVRRLAEEGRLKPHVSEVFPLDQAREALLRLYTRGAIGKIVIRP